MNGFFIVDDLNADSELMGERAALKGVTKEQTASLQTALLHGHSDLVCGPRCEPLSGVSIPIPWTSTSRATEGRSSLPAAGLACHLRLLAFCLLREEIVVLLACPRPGAAVDNGAAGSTFTCRASNTSATHHQRPQDASVLVGRRQNGFRPGFERTSKGLRPFPATHVIRWPPVSPGL